MPSRDAAPGRAHRHLRRALLLRARAGAARRATAAAALHWYDAYAELREKLDALGRRLGGSYRVLVDANQHVDREAAARSGVGFYGKNTLLITRRHGSWVVLGTLVTDLELEATPPLGADCGVVPPLHRRVPDRRARRAGHARRDALPLLLDAGARGGARSRTARPRRAGLRLRHLPGRVPVEPRHRETPGGDAPPAGAEPHVSLVDWLAADADELAARYDRLFVPRNDARWLRRNALVAARERRRRGRARRGRAVSRQCDDDLLA